MTAKELATLLDGIEYPVRIQSNILKAVTLVVLGLAI